MVRRLQAGRARSLSTDGLAAFGYRRMERPARDVIARWRSYLFRLRPRLAGSVGATRVPAAPLIDAFGKPGWQKLRWPCGTVRAGHGVVF